MKLSFENKLFIVLIVIVFYVLALGMIVHRNNNNLISGNENISHSVRVLNQSAKVLSLLKDAETGVRGFVITMDSSFLNPYLKAKDSIEYLIKDLKSGTADNKDQQLKAEILHNLAIRYINLCNAIANQASDFKNDIPGLLPKLRVGKVIMDSARILVSSLENTGSLILKDRQRANAENNKQLSRNLFLLVGGLILMLVIVTFLLRRYLFILKRDNISALQLKNKLRFFSKQVNEIFNGITDPLFTVDGNWNFIYLNTATQKRMEYDKGSLIGKNIFEVFSRYKETAIGQNMLKVRQTQKGISFDDYDELFEYWQNITIYPTAEGVTVYMKNVTERKLTEAELIKTKLFLEETNEVALVGGWDVDIKKGTLYWTPVTHLIHETSPGFEPDLIKAVDFYKEGQSRDTIAKLIDKAIADGSGWDTELQIITAKGNEKWVRAKGKAILEGKTCVRLYGTFQDIDEQKKLNYKVKQSEKQFRSAFENSSIGMALISPEGKWNEVNESLCNIVGYNQQELFERTFRDITHPDDLETDLKLLQELIEEKRQRYTLEKRYLHKDGHIVWISLAVSMVKDQNGKIVHFISQIQDITEKRNAETLLKSERKLLRTLIDNIPLNIYIKDLQSRKTLVNKKELEYIGHQNESAVLGKTDFDLYPEDTALASLEEDQLVINSGIPIISKETINIKNDGSETHFLSSKIPFYNEQNDITGILGISYDITDSIKIKKALVASELKLSSLFGLSPVGFALSDYKTGEFLDCNSSFLARLGYNKEELLGITRLQVKPEKYWEQEKMLLQSIQNGGYFGPVEMEHIRKDGSIYPMLISGLKLLDADNRELLWTVVQDITQLKENESELMSLNVSIKENNRLLALKNDELEQYAYVASHDLQEPLRMITGFISKIERKYAHLLDDDGKKYIQFTVDGATRMRQIILDILEYSRLGSTQELVTVPLDLNAVVNKISNSILANREGLLPIINCEQLPVIIADKTFMEQLFSNLITNGIKYQKAGNKPVINIAAEELKDYWKFSVSDNGIGIDQKYFGKVFTVFQRLHSKEQYSGTGIGLAICKKIINNLKGEIWIESTPGNGATFYFTILK
ncbi:MAG: PAS domain S-box protein [Ferruginibacter sp.]